jgi:[NiFe] hydrogenase diaphorase moiety large subunit
MVNDVVVTNLTPELARQWAQALKAGQSPEDIISDRFAELTPHHEEGARHHAPQIIDTIEASGLRGCGGAGIHDRAESGGLRQRENRRAALCHLQCRRG